MQWWRKAHVAWFLAVVMVVFSVGPVAMASVESSSEPTGAIAGRVTLPAGTTPSSVSVRLYALLGLAPHSTWMTVWYTRTYDDGKYVFDGVGDGTYLVQVEVDVERGSPQVATTFHGGSLMRTATRITVADGERVDGIDVSPPPAGEISGVVSVPAGFDGSRVSAYLWAMDDDGRGPRWTSLSAVQVDEEGRFTLSKLAPDTAYRVSFHDESTALETEFHDDVPTVEQAKDVTVVAGGVTRVDATLGKGATVVGRVTQVGGGGVDGALVSVMRHFEESGDEWWDVVAGTRADAEGRYEVTGLPAGTYRVHFDDIMSATKPEGLIPEYHPDAATVDEAADVVVGHRQAVTVDAELAVGATVSGTITSPQGLMVRAVQVVAHRRSGPDSDPQWKPVWSGSADVDGHYLINRLLPGTYRLQFVDSSRRWFTSEFFDDVSTLDEAKDVVVGRGAAVAGINATMGTGAAISGVVRASDGRRVAGVEVTAYTLVDGVWTASVTAAAANDGRFELVGLGGAAHRLGFRDPSGRLVSEYYFDADTVTAARDLVVGSRERISGIVAELEVDPDAPLPAIALLSAPRVTGDRLVGRTLSVTAGEWSPASTSTSYQWFVNTADGVRALAGETRDSLVLTEALAGQQVRVRVTASAEGWADGVHDSEWSVVKPEPEPEVVKRLTAPKVTGTPKVGNTLRVSRGTWQPGAVTTSYQWFVKTADGEGALAGEGRESLVLTEALAGQQVRVRVTASAEGWADGVHDSEWSVVEVPEPKAIKRLKAPKVTGKAKVGRTLRVSRGTWKPGAVTVKYQWFVRKGGKVVPIAKSTKSSLKLTRSLLGKKVRVRLVVSAAGHTSYSHTSGWSKKVARR